MKDLLTILQRDCTLSTEKLAQLTGMTPEEVVAERARLEAQGIISGYQAMVNWEKFDGVTAMIQVKITPQASDGFDRVAERIGLFDEVESVYLMSGGDYDLTVIITGSTLRDVAEFVSGRLALIQGVTATATHFMLKKYKDHHNSFIPPVVEEREHFMV